LFKFVDFEHSRVQITRLLIAGLPFRGRWRKSPTYCASAPYGSAMYAGIAATGSGIQPNGSIFPEKRRRTIQRWCC